MLLLFLLILVEKFLLAVLPKVYFSSAPSLEATFAFSSSSSLSPKITVSISCATKFQSDCDARLLLVDDDDDDNPLLLLVRKGVVDDGGGGGAIVVETSSVIRRRGGCGWEDLLLCDLRIAKFNKRYTKTCSVTANPKILRILVLALIVVV